jgi:type IV secretion system protein VirD4
MTPDEVMRLPGPTKISIKQEDGTTKDQITEPGEMLIFVAGQPVIKGRQILYFKDPVFSKRSLIPPPPTDRVRVDMSLSPGLKTSTSNGGFVVQ